MQLQISFELPSISALAQGRSWPQNDIEPSLTYFQYLEKRLFVQLNGSRKVIGVLRGYDVCYL
jgi:hypothetical protein